MAAVRALPMRAVLALGSLLGRAFYRFDGGHRRLALRNLEAAFPLRSRQECRAIARDMFSHFGRLLMVLLKFSTMAPRRMLEHVGAALRELADRVGIVGARWIYRVLVDHPKPAARQRQREHRHHRRAGP